MEYYDRTLFELSIELQGYNSRWEEKWRHTRMIYTLLYNQNVDKKDRKKAIELMPLPEEYEEVNLRRRVLKKKADKDFMNELKR